MDGKLLFFVQPVVAGKAGVGAIGAGNIIAVEGGVGGRGGGHPAHTLHVFDAVGHGVDRDLISGAGLVQIHGMDGRDLAALDVLPGAGSVQEPDRFGSCGGVVVPDEVYDRGGQIPRGVRRFRHVGRVFFHRQRAVLKLQHRQRHGTLGGVILPLGEHAAEDVYRHHILMASDGESVIGRGARRAPLGVAAHGGVNFAVPRGIVQIIPDQLGLTARRLTRGGDPQAKGGLFGAGLQGDVLNFLRQRIRLLKQLLLRRGEHAGFSRACRGKLFLFGNVDPGGKGGKRNLAVFRSVRRVQGACSIRGRAPTALPERPFQFEQNHLRRDLQPEAQGNGRAAALAQPQKRLDVAVETDGEAEKVLYTHAAADAQLRQNGDGHAGAEVQRHIGHAGPVGGKTDAERRAQREGEVHRAEAGNGPDHEGIGIAALEGHLHAGVAFQTNFFLQTLAGRHLGDAPLQGGKGREHGLDVAEEFGGLAGTLILIHLIVDRVRVPLALPGRFVHALGLVFQTLLLPAQFFAFEGLAVGVLDVAAGIDDHLRLDERQTQIHLQVAYEGRVRRELEAEPAGGKADELIVVEYRLFHVGLFDLQLGLEGTVVALGGNLRPDGNGGAGGDQTAVFARKGNGLASGEFTAFFRFFQAAVFIVGLVDQIQGARQHLLTGVFQHHVDGLLGVVFGGVIDGVLLHHDVAAVIAGHAQVGNAGVFFQSDDLRLPAPQSETAHFPGVVLAVGDDHVQRDPPVRRGNEIRHQKGGQSVFPGGDGLQGAGIARRLYGDLRVFQQLALVIPDDEPELLGGQGDYAEIHAVPPVDMGLFFVGQGFGLGQQLFLGLLGDGAVRRVRGLQHVKEVQLVGIDRFFVLLIVTNHGADDGLHFRHIFPYLVGQAALFPLGQLGVLLQLVQAVEYGQPPRFQTIPVMIQLIPELAQQVFDPFQRLVAQQLSLVPDTHKQAAYLIGKQPFQILLNLQGVHGRRGGHAFFPALNIALHGDQLSGLGDLLLRQRNISVGQRGQLRQQQNQSCQ